MCCCAAANIRCPRSERAKIALFCNVPQGSGDPGAGCQQHLCVPLQYHAEGLDDEVLRAFGITDAPAPDLSRWEDIVDRYSTTRRRSDDRRGRQICRPARRLQERSTRRWCMAAWPTGSRSTSSGSTPRMFEGGRRRDRSPLEPMHGILVPGGFGERGSEGKIASCALPANARCRSSASASACRWPASRRAQHGRDRRGLLDRIRPDR
jgi:CTP synthase